MKTKIYNLLLIIGLFSSCDHFLDVDVKGKVVPQTVEDYDEMLNLPIESAITNLDYMIPELELTEDELPGLSVIQSKGYRWEPYQYLSGENDDNYSELYKRIYAANEIINHIDGVESVTGNELLRTEVKGTAYADRARCYWALVNLYGFPYSKADEDKPGVALMLENNLAQKNSRATVGEVYEQICKDLRMAAALVPVKVAPVKKGRASRQAVNAFQARVWLYMNQIDSAEVAINKAFESSVTLLDYNEFVSAEQLESARRPCLGNGTRPTLHTEKNDEIVWNGPIYYFTFFMNPPSVSNDFIRLFDADRDLRFILDYGTTNPFDAQQIYATTRYFARGQNRTYLVSSPEIYLLKAEILARKGDHVNAIITLNTLREKRYITGSTYQLSANNAADALTEIKKERMREWGCTFLTWFDLRRYQAYGEDIPTFQRKVGEQTYTLTPGSNLYTLSIPPYVIEKIRI